MLKKIKNGCSIFLPKYYIVVNKDNPYKDSVFMDYIPSRNLKEFLHVGATSVSLLTKLYLIFSIIQSLRYIRDYRIVHLDLKPNNIMIFVNMLIKLIDFGEAYHPELTCTHLLIQLIILVLLCLIVLQRCSTNALNSPPKVTYFHLVCLCLKCSMVPIPLTSSTLEYQLRNKCRVT